MTLVVRILTFFICDISGTNPNVLYELGIRQAFNYPVTIIKDSITKNIFDIQALRFIEYSESLRIDHIQTDIVNVCNSLNHTFDAKGKDINSIVQLLGIQAAEKPQTVEISKDTEMILNAVNNLSKRIVSIETDDCNINNILSGYDNNNKNIKRMALL